MINLMFWIGFGILTLVLANSTVEDMVDDGRLTRSEANATRVAIVAAGPILLVVVICLAVWDTIQRR